MRISSVYVPLTATFREESPETPGRNRKRKPRAEEEAGLRSQDEAPLLLDLVDPVVWVSWHEALACCQWLTTKLASSDRTPEPLRRLPDFVAN